MITLDGEPIKDVVRTPRQDVYDAYAETYLGFIDKNTLGWQVSIPLHQYDPGSHKLKVFNRLNETILAEKEIVFTIE